MDVQIRAADSHGRELAALGEWLQDEREFRGYIRTVYGQTSETELGPVVEILVVALGSGGAGTVLVSSLKTWMITRRTTAKITVEVEGRSVTLDIETADDVTPLLNEILNIAKDS